MWQFVAHRDVYGPIDRCGGYRSRDVQWNGGFNQAILKSGVYDPDMQNDDLCRVGGNGAPTSYANDGHCDDPTGLGGLVTKAQCDLGTDMTDCGVHENLVVFGYGNPKVVYDEQGVPKDFAATFCYGKDGSIHTGREYSTVECSDGASYIDSGAPATCYYGTDPACPMRRFAFLPEDAGPEEADDSCATSGDGQCDDGLLYSQYAPGQNTCAPNTDVRAIVAPHNCVNTPISLYTSLHTFNLPMPDDRLWLAHGQAHASRGQGGVGHVQGALH